MEKFKTIEDVFLHNFETLNEWRPFINVPHRLPDAVRYFVAQRLDNEAAIAGLMADQPEHRVCNMLTFPDHTVLMPPDEIFQDEATYVQIVYGAGILERISGIESELDLLPQVIELDDFFNKAADILNSLDRLSIKKSDFVTATLVHLADDLSAVLIEAFRRSANQQDFAKRLHAIVERAHQCAVPLKLHREIEAALS